MTTTTLVEAGAGAGMGPASAPVQSPDDLAPEGHVGPWLPTTVRDVEWCMERLGEAEADRLEILAQLDAAKEALVKRAAEIIDKSERRAEWFRSLVEAWAKSHRGEVVRGKAKTRELLGGSIAFRASAEKVVILDEDAFIAWAQADHLDLCTVKTVPDKRALAAFVESSGEIPPGCDVDPATETVQIKTAPLPTLTAGRKELP